MVERIPALFRKKLDILLYWAIFGAGLLWMVVLYSQSPGTPVQDEIGHYLISRHAWQFPDLILHEWGRTVNTLVYMIPALGDLQVARLSSILMASLTVLVTSALGREMGLRKLYWIPLLLWFQPWFADLSYAVITEVPFSLCLALGLYFWIKEDQKLAGLAIGLLPLIRHEGIALLGLWGLYALATRQWRAILISVLPLFFYNLAYYLVFHQLAASIYTAIQPTTLYGQGSWFHFVRPVIDNAGLTVMILGLFSLFTLPRLKKKAFILIMYLAYFMVHTVIYHFGLYASGGYSLFLLPLAPGLALAAGLGAEWILQFARRALDRSGARRLSAAFALLAVLVIGGMAVRTGLSVMPRVADSEQITEQQAAGWLRANGYASAPVVSTHVWFYYYFDLPWTDGRDWARPPALDSLTGGTILVWDSHYSNRLKLSLAALSDPTRGWAQLAQFNNHQVIIFQKLAN